MSAVLYSDVLALPDNVTSNDDVDKFKDRTVGASV